MTIRTWCVDVKYFAKNVNQESRLEFSCKFLQDMKSKVFEVAIPVREARLRVCPTHAQPSPRKDQPSLVQTPLAWLGFLYLLGRIALAYQESSVLASQ